MAKVELNDIPKIITALILRILLIIIPFWFIFGILDPMSYIIDIGFLGSYYLNMDPNPSDDGSDPLGGNQGNSSGLGPNKPNNFFDVVMGKDNTYKEALQDKASRCRAIMQEEAQRLTSDTEVVDLPYYMFKHFYRYVDAHSEYSKTIDELARKGCMPKPASPILVQLIKGNSPFVDFNNLAFKDQIGAHPGKYILGRDVHTMLENGKYNPYKGVFKTEADLPAASKNMTYPLPPMKTTR